MASVDPDLPERLARATLEAHSRAVAELLEKVARRTARGITTPGWAEAKLTDTLRLQREAQEVVNRLGRHTPNILREALEEAYRSGAKNATMEVGGGFARSSGRAVQELLKETLTGMGEAHTAILRTTMDKYRSIIAEVTPNLAGGVESRRAAGQAAIRRFARAGIGGFRDSAGRLWEIESFAEMATRTASGRAHIAGALDRFESQGRDLVIVSNHSEECAICRPYEGKVLSISGNAVGKKLSDGVTVFTSVAKARAGGLLHASCRHALNAYVPGLTKVPTGTADPEGDKQRQRHRALERQVRAAKRNTAAQEAFVAQLKAEGAVSADALAELKRAKMVQAAANRRLTDFVETHDRKRLRYREAVRPKPAQ